MIPLRIIKSLLGFALATCIVLCGCHMASSKGKQLTNRECIAGMKDLIAFWDFSSDEDNVWTSYFDSTIIDRSFPLYLRQIGDEQNYARDEWPYTDSQSRLVFDGSGPFGNAVRFNKGYIYGSVPRKSFDSTLLNLYGKKPFTLIAWVKFIGQRHLVAGIWDEGGWLKYGGQRQVALFAGLFQQKGVLGHISATGAASFPQSGIDGAQYARIRAIDGEPFENEEWVALAMTYDPDSQLVNAYLNGKMTDHMLTDPVAQDVFKYTEVQSANPLHFDDAIFSPQQFLLKYNGYDFTIDGIYEHALQVDFIDRTLLYEQIGALDATSSFEGRISFDVKRNGVSILDSTIYFAALSGLSFQLPKTLDILPGDEIHTALVQKRIGKWSPVGTAVQKVITQGAPFTFGRALGLASEEIEHGSQLFVDGIAVFNRCLTEEKLREISFNH